MRIELGPRDRPVAGAILGDRDVGEALAELVDAEECFFLASSAGMLFGLRLRDGSRVAVKLIRPRPGLEAARDVQRTLHDRGFPCPRPLVGPVPFGRGWAVVDEWVDALQRDVHEPARRAEAARLLAQLVALAPRRDGLPRALQGDGLFPEPHHARFDFGRVDGRWIDELAAPARTALAEPAPLVVGHSDWSAKHFGWDDGRIAIVYDWPDSVALDAEETLVGYASAVFPATWDIPVRSYVASRDESEAFVDEYEHAAGRRLHRRRVAAARTYVLAYCARCELSDLDGAEGQFQLALRGAG